MQKSSLMTNSSPYEALPKPSCIRLLTIEPGLERDKIRCNFQVVDLSVSPPYEAVSYVWGNPNPPTLIACNGVRMNITQNLADALRRFRPLPDYFDTQRTVKPKRKRGEDDPPEWNEPYGYWARRAPADRPRNRPCRLLWVDALCINQQDNDEKSSQVMMMRHIYARAKNVLVWLGPHVEEVVPQALGLMHTALRNLNREVTPGKPSPVAYEVSTMEKHMARGFPSPEAPDWMALEWFYGQAWFSRVWVLQEVAVAESITAFLGDFEIKANYIGYAALWFVMKGYANEWGPLTLTGDLSKAAFLLNRTKNMLSEDNRPKLLSLLGYVRTFKATLPQDKVYAVLGISQEGNSYADSPLKPDYNKSVAEVYRDTTRYLIWHNVNLDVLSHTVPSDISGDYDAPSWAARWDVRNGQKPLIDGPAAGLYNADSGMEMHLVDGNDDNVLRLRGISFDSILSFSDVLSDPAESMKQLWHVVQCHLGTKALYVTGKDTIVVAFLLTTTAGRNFAGRSGKADRNFLSYAAAFWSHFIREDPPEALLHHQKRFWRLRRRLRVFWKVLRSRVAEWWTYLRARNTVLSYSWEEWSWEVEAIDARMFERAALAIFPGRVFAITSEKYMCLGPARMQSGDKLVVLAGGKVPYVLRPRGTTYEFIG